MLGMCCAGKAETSYSHATGYGILLVSSRTDVSIKLALSYYYKIGFLLPSKILTD